jgi:hypothetical protein
MHALVHALLGKVISTRGMFLSPIQAYTKAQGESYKFVTTCVILRWNGEFIVNLHFIDLYSLFWSAVNF